jgi:hypothetical protein
MRERTMSTFDHITHSINHHWEHVWAAHEMVATFNHELSLLIIGLMIAVLYITALVEEEA